MAMRTCLGWLWVLLCMMACSPSIPTDECKKDADCPCAHTCGGGEGRSECVPFQDLPRANFRVWSWYLPEQAQSCANADLEPPPGWPQDPVVDESGQPVLQEDGSPLLQTRRGWGTCFRGVCYDEESGRFCNMTEAQMTRYEAISITGLELCRWDGEAVDGGLVGGEMDASVPDSLVR